MPKLGTMHLRSESAPTRVVSGFLFPLTVCFAVAVCAQTAPVQNQPAQTTPASQNQASPGGQPVPQQQQQPQESQPQQQPSNPNVAPPPQNQPSGAPSDGGAAQGQSQAPSATDNGVFVFHAEAREVTLHATVVDERNRLITNLN